MRLPEGSQGASGKAAAHLSTFAPPAPERDLNLRQNLNPRQAHARSVPGPQQAHGRSATGRPAQMRVAFFPGYALNCCVMQIDIVSDTVCPWCFIGKRRLERALAARPERAVEVGWRPFQLNPDLPAEGMDRAEYVAQKFGKERAQRIYDTIRSAGEEVGIPFAFDAIRRMPSTLRSHQLIRWAGGAGVQDQVVEALFQSFFLKGEDIGADSVLAEIAAAAGMDRALVLDLLARDADAELVRAEDQVARDMGIAGVPCFIINRKYALSGAQDPAVFLQVFDLAEREEEAAAKTPSTVEG